ncbi:MAG: transcriptional regulator NrdR [Patescibacteria group bacterium]
MRCPICAHDTKVADTRGSTLGEEIRRRRECLKCKHRFTTVEEIALLDLVVVKRDGRRESYSRDKLSRGIIRALEKRPHTANRLKQLIREIEHDLQCREEDEITSLEIGNIAMRRLRGFDKVAYIRFASVYRQFEDVGMFKKELAELERKKRRRKKN